MADAQVRIAGRGHVRQRCGERVGNTSAGDIGNVLPVKGPIEEGVEQGEPRIGRFRMLLSDPVGSDRDIPHAPVGDQLYLVLELTCFKLARIATDLRAVAQLVHGLLNGGGQVGALETFLLGRRTRHGQESDQTERSDHQVGADHRSTPFDIAFILPLLRACAMSPRQRDDSDPGIAV